MFCAASQPVIDDLTRSDAKPGTVSTLPHGSAGKQKAVAQIFSGDSANRYGDGSSGRRPSKESLRNDSAADALGKQPSGEVKHADERCESAGATHGTFTLPSPHQQQQRQQQEQLPSALQQISPFEALRRQQQQKLEQQQQQQPHQDPQPVRPMQRQVHDSADSAEARDIKKSFNAAAAADRLRGSQDDPSSPFSTVSQASAAAADAMRGWHSSFQGSASSDTAGSSQEDTFPELGACSGHAMNRLSQVYSRRLSRTDERGSAGVTLKSSLSRHVAPFSCRQHSIQHSAVPVPVRSESHGKFGCGARFHVVICLFWAPADLDRRQSLNYMKQVDSIVQSFDIQEDEIQIERDADGNDLVLGHGAYGQVRLPASSANLPACSTSCHGTTCHAASCRFCVCRCAVHAAFHMITHTVAWMTGARPYLAVLCCSGVQGGEGRCAGRRSQGAVRRR